MVVPPRAAHVPRVEKHPSARLIPFVNDDVPAPWTLMTPVVSITPDEVVALPTPSPPVRYPSPVTDRLAAGEDVAIPNRLLTVSNTRTVVVAAFRMRKAFGSFWNE